MGFGVPRLGCHKKAKCNYCFLVQSLMGILLGLFCSSITQRRPAGNPCFPLGNWQCLPVVVCDAKANSP